MSHGRVCTHIEHVTAYACQRCNDVQCMDCDQAVESVRERRHGVKTIAGRYCSDWRCQREKQIEEGSLVVSVKA